MTKLTSEKAYELLIENVINDKSDLEKMENRWVWHCIYVAQAAERIAKRLNLDSDYAMALGYIHDIGRKIDHFNHPLEGYQYMKKKGYESAARICLTHSFIDNDILMTAGGGPKNPVVYSKIKDFLAKNPPNIYDNIIQMCDLFCSERGFTTVEKRLLDISERKGIYPNSQKHFAKVLELKKRIEEKMGCSLYSLFPEIDEKDLENIDIHRQRLIQLLNVDQNLKK